MKKPFLNQGTTSTQGTRLYETTKTPLERNYSFLSALIRIRYAAVAAELKPALASRLRASVIQKYCHS
jgi:hypothetical protein